MSNSYVQVVLLDENNDWYGIPQVNGKPRVYSMPYLYDIAEGNIAGHEGWKKNGFNGDVDVGIEHMWSVGGLYVFPTAAMQMEVVSSSLADDSGGTGVNSVILYYLDGNGIEKSEDITLDGTNAVPTVATDIYRIQNFRAKTVGSGKKAAGDIDIRHIDNTPIYSRIPVGLVRARNSAYTVPAGHALLVTSGIFSVVGISKANSYTVRFSTMANYDDKRNVFLDYMMSYTDVLIEDGVVNVPFEKPTKLPAMTDILVEVQAFTDNCICACALRGWLEHV